MPKKIEVWECEHCKKHITRTKGGMRGHERKCFWNPESKSCMTCDNFITGGHYASQCKFKHMNKSEKYSDNEYHQQIKKLQTKCELYKFDGLSFEERNKLIDESYYDAKADHDDYENNRM